jgi:ATP-binding cassette, subfamily B, multidrug efflux pump
MSTVASPASPGGPGPGGGQRPTAPPPGMGRGGGPMSGLTVPVQKSQDFTGSLSRLMGRLRPERVVIGVVLAAAVVSVALSVLGPRLLGNATTLIFDGVVGARLPDGLTKEEAVAELRDRGETQLADMVAGMDVVPGSGVDVDRLAQLLTLVTLVYLLSSLFAWVQGYLMAGVTQRTVYELRAEVEGKIGRLPLTYFDTHPRGDVLSRVTNDIDNISTTMQQVLTQLVTSLLSVIGVLVMMLLISPLLALISLLVVPLSFVVTLAIARRSQEHFVAQWDWTGQLNGHVEEMYTGHDVVKVYGRQQVAVEEFDRLNESMYGSSYRAQFISGIIQPAMAFIGNLNYVAIAVIGGLRVANGTMPIGDVQAFIQYSRQFTMPITQVASVVNLMQSGVASAERVFELLDADEESPEPEQPAVLDGVRGRVAFEDVSFRYRPDRPLIDGLDLLVQPGEAVAIVGPTGAGKTTLVNLLMRFYEVDAGRITVDGVDTRHLTRDDVRRCFGMVLQDTWLFSGTIRDNIAYGRTDATDAEVVAAAEAAHLDHVVRTLPDGYDTTLDDEASNLSVGERQLVTIARAFLADAPVLILDEATSSVDTRTEVLIQKAMTSLRQGRTSFVIAHRLSTIRDADTILVMESGSIVEQGDHDDLIARRGAYFQLYTSQFLGSDA